MCISQARQRRCKMRRRRQSWTDPLRTEAEGIRDFLQGLRGKIDVTFEKRIQAACLYEIFKPVVTEVIECNPRMNKLLAVGNKADRADGEKLAELLRCRLLKWCITVLKGVKLLKELMHSYDAASRRHDTLDEPALDEIHQAPVEGYYHRLTAKEMRPEMAPLTLARKIVGLTSLRGIEMLRR
jgi:hypothetical protein